MPHCFSRQLLTLAIVSSCFSCSSDQNRPANTPEDVPPAESPSDTTASPPGDPTPTGQPTGMPPAQPESRSGPTNTQSAGAASAAEPMAPLSQNQVAMVADLANTSEVEQGKLAESKAKAPSVKKFAAMMVKHHTEAKQEQAKLFKKLNLTPAQSQKSSALKEDADKMMTSLKGVDGPAFDVAYMNSQVDAHQKVLDAIDKDLLPAASDQELINGLKKMRGTVESHLTEAKTLQAQLLKTSNTSAPRADSR